MIRVANAPPYATVQDLGREGYRAIGIPMSGVSDRDTALALNALLRNEPGAAMLEWAVAGGTLSFHVDVTLAFGGAKADVFVGDRIVGPYSPVHVRLGEELRVERLVRGRFLYIAVRGGIDVPLMLGSRSTLMSAGFGGHDGRRLRKGDVLRIRAGGADESFVAAAEAVAHQAGLQHISSADDDVIPVIRGPQADLFSADAWSSFLGATYSVSRASDRVGYRMDGPPLAHSGAAALPSEPTCLGAIQVPNGGTPIVLMNDGPTVGGYPKIAVVRSTAMSRFAQKAPGDPVRFVLAG
ncbi:MAG: biotin-dependent carboxyltransferase family protein [Gemmatimonadaceae bacterium]